MPYLSNMLREDSRETVVEYFRDKGLAYKHPLPFSELGYYVYNAEVSGIHKKRQCFFWIKTCITYHYRFLVQDGVLIVMYESLKLKRIYLFTKEREGNTVMEVIYRNDG